MTLSANTASEPNALHAPKVEHAAERRLPPQIRRADVAAPLVKGRQCEQRGKHAGYESQVHDRCRDPQLDRRRLLPGTGRQEGPDGLDALVQNNGAIDQLARRPP
jgi:hypothetical protein